jgi:hypothetical protein
MNRTTVEAVLLEKKFTCGHRFGSSLLFEMSVLYVDYTLLASCFLCYTQNYVYYTGWCKPDDESVSS